MPAERRRRRRPGGGWSEDGKRLEVAAVRGWARRCPRGGGGRGGRITGARRRRQPADGTWNGSRRRPAITIRMYSRGRGRRGKCCLLKTPKKGGFPRRLVRKRLAATAATPGHVSGATEATAHTEPDARRAPREESTGIGTVHCMHCTATAGTRGEDARPTTSLCGSGGQAVLSSATSAGTAAQRTAAGTMNPRGIGRLARPTAQA